ncbi:MAG: acyl carrier protein [Rhodanobacter sp.]|jgi:acyl carrier protein|nr:acyl carrier protein [Rhodanobacter sp.]
MSTVNTKPIEHLELLAQLSKVTAEALQVDSVDPEAPLAEIGIDSLNIVEVIIACEEIYGDFRIDPARLEFDEMTSLADMHNQMIAFGRAP